MSVVVDLIARVDEGRVYAGTLLACYAGLAVTILILFLMEGFASGPLPPPQPIPQSWTFRLSRGAVDRLHVERWISNRWGDRACWLVIVGDDGSSEVPIPTAWDRCDGPER